MLFAAGAQRVGASPGGSEYPAPVVYAANDAAIAYTDCVAPSFVGGYARFQRPIADTGSDYQYAMPGARMRFVSSAPVVTIGLRWNGLITRTDARNLIGHVYVDGVYNRDFQTPAGINVVTTANVVLNMGSSASRTYELVLPYADGVEFGPVTVNYGFTVTAAAARTGRIMACFGDSITQGFTTSDLRRGWVDILARAKGFRTINMGYGGRGTVSSDGTTIANLSPDLITVLIGTNDDLAQTPVATYKANLKQLLTNIHTVNSTVPVYISAPIPCTQSLTIPFSSYAAVAGQCVSELGYSQLIGVSNSSLITNTATQLQADGVHPNDAGATQMAAGWGAVIT